jgi:hypothetical protein
MGRPTIYLTIFLITCLTAYGATTSSVPTNGTEAITNCTYNSTCTASGGSDYCCAYVNYTYSSVVTNYSQCLNSTDITLLTTYLTALQATSVSINCTTTPDPDSSSSGSSSGLSFVIIMFAIIVPVMEFVIIIVLCACLFCCKKPVPPAPLPLESGATKHE